MIRINDDFELEHDGSQWLLYEWYDSHTKDGLQRKRKSPLYFSALTHVCSTVIDRSAGKACNRSQSIKKAIQDAKWDIVLAICGGGWR